MEIRPIVEVDLNEVSCVHMMAFPDSALTRLGSDAIRRYYLWQLNGPHDSLCIGAFDGIRMAGFCFAGVFRGAETGFLRKNRMFLIWRLITHPWLLTHKVVRNRINYSIQAIKRIAGQEKKRTVIPIPVTSRFGILSIAVHPQYIGLGIGKLLMQNAEMSARQKCFTSMRLTVHPENKRAVLFYEKLGWKKVILTDDIWYGAMVKNLGNGNE